MAILKEIEIDGSGVSASYWRIYRVDATFSPAGGAAINVTIDGWASADARSSGKNPVPRSQKTISIEMENAGDADEMTKTMIYDAVKQNAAFLGAENV